MPILLVAFAVGSALASSEVSISQDSGMVSAKAMEHVFFRSEAAHSKSMASITGGMSAKSAWQVLQKSNLTTPALVELTNQHAKQSNLRKAAPTGYAAVDGARDLLNDMIFQSSEKYDKELLTAPSHMQTSALLWKNVEERSLHPTMSPRRPGHQSWTPRKQ